MSVVKKLLGQTAIYGVPSILGRFINYLLFPLYTTSQFTPAEYGVVTEMYAYVAFFVVLLGYGMETAFFRFVKDNDEEHVYSNAVFSLVSTSLLFVVFIFCISPSLSAFMGYAKNPEYVQCFALILGIDAVSSIAMARLRQDNKAFKFAFANLASIFVNVGLNLFFLFFAYQAYKSGDAGFLAKMYNPNLGVLYIFYINLVASIVKLLILSPELLKVKWQFNISLQKRMLLYGLPLLVAGFGGIINEMLDRVMLKYLLRDQMGELEAMAQLGIYGGVYKLSIIISLVIQAFRYAAEPFFFKLSGGDSRQGYVSVMNYFVFLLAGIFLFVSLYIDIFKHLLRQEAYWQGLKIVPILLMANAFLGISYNLSIWYKLADKTRFGAYISLIGAVITVGLNLWWVPIFGYEGAAWATLICYLTIAFLNYVMGQKHYPIPYQLSKNLLVLGSAIALWFLDKNLTNTFLNNSFVVKFLFLLIFAAVFIYLEKPKFLFKANGDNKNN